MVHFLSSGNFTRTKISSLHKACSIMDSTWKSSYEQKNESQASFFWFILMCPVLGNFPVYSVELSMCKPVDSRKISELFKINWYFWQTWRNIDVFSKLTDLAWARSVSFDWNKFTDLAWARWVSFDCPRIVSSVSDMWRWVLPALPISFGRTENGEDDLVKRLTSLWWCFILKLPGSQVWVQDALLFFRTCICDSDVVCYFINMDVNLTAWDSQWWAGFWCLCHPH